MRCQKALNKLAHVCCRADEILALFKSQKCLGTKGVYPQVKEVLSYAAVRMRCHERFKRPAIAALLSLNGILLVARAKDIAIEAQAEIWRKEFLDFFTILNYSSQIVLCCEQK